MSDYPFHLWLFTGKGLWQLFTDLFREGDDIYCSYYAPLISNVASTVTTSNSDSVTLKERCCYKFGELLFQTETQNSCRQYRILCRQCRGPIIYDLQRKIKTFLLILFTALQFCGTAVMIISLDTEFLLPAQSNHKKQKITQQLP